MKDKNKVLFFRDMLRWVGTAFLFISQLKYLDAADCPCVSGSWKYNGKLNFKFLFVGAFKVAFLLMKRQYYVFRSESDDAERGEE